MFSARKPRDLGSSRSTKNIYNRREREAKERISRCPHDDMTSSDGSPGRYTYYGGLIFDRYRNGTVESGIKKEKQRKKRQWGRKGTVKPARRHGGTILAATAVFVSYLHAGWPWHLSVLL